MEQMRVWRYIPEGKGMYMISNMGEVMSCVKRPEWYLLKPYKDSCGYLYVQICKKNRAVHKLVANTFLQPSDCGREINHKDGDKENNCAENLEWCTRSENVQHAFDHGLKQSLKRGAHKMARRVVCIETQTQYECMEDAAEATGAVPANISKCVRGLRQTAGGYHWRYADGGDPIVATV